MAEYFSSVSRHLARLRCLEELLKAVVEKRPVPESLCYTPSFEYFEISEKCGNHSGQYSPTSVPVLFFYEPIPVLSQEVRHNGRLKSYEVGTLFMCRRLQSKDIDDDDQSNPKALDSTEDLVWLEIIGIWHKQSSKPKRFKKPMYFLWNRATSNAGQLLRINGDRWVRKEDVFKPLRSQIITHGNGKLGEAAGCTYVFDRWEDVVELSYGICVAKEKLLNCVTPPNYDRVSAMRLPPSADWDHRHDEALVQFLVNTGQAVDDKGGRACDLWAHVEKIELSSAMDHMTDAIAALTDDNPSTYWESDGSQSSHHIRLHMKKHVVIEKIYLTIDVADDSYLPQKVCVLASDDKRHDTSEMKKLNEIPELETEYSGDVCIYEAAEGTSDSYAIVEIQIVECKDEGIDTRIRGLKIKTRQETDPVEVDIEIDEQRLKEHPILLYAAVDMETIKWRSVILKRSATLLDSVLHLLVPRSELQCSDSELTNELLEDDDLSPFSDILKIARFLLPLSHKRQSVFERLLKETESEKYEACPKLYINRQLARDNRTNVDSTVFRQIYEGLTLAGWQDDITLDYRWSIKHEQWWECKFIGEGVIDQGGGFRDSLCDMAEELCPSDSDSPLPLPYFVRAPNQHGDEHNRDNFVVNAGCTDFEGFMWIGKLLGACLRTKEHLILPLTKLTWKQILGQSLCWTEDFITVDRRLVRLTEKIQHMQREDFDQYFGVKDGAANATMTTTLCNGDVIELIPSGSSIPLSFDNRLEYVEKLKKRRLQEGQEQINALRLGLLRVIPEGALRLLTWFELERRISGNPDVSMEGLKKAARYEELEGTEMRVQYLWEALERFTNEERSKFLRFVTGRRRLPTPLYICTDKGDSLLGEPDRNVLPESSTCSNTLFLPDYPSAKICEEKLRYAIYNCLAIDTDMTPWEE